MLLVVSGWPWCEQALLFKSTVQQPITALGMVDPARVSTEAAIMGNLAKVSQLEQQAVLKKVGKYTLLFLSTAKNQKNSSSEHQDR